MRRVGPSPSVFPYLRGFWQNLPLPLQLRVTSLVGAACWLEGVGVEPTLPRLGLSSWSAGRDSLEASVPLVDDPRPPGTLASTPKTWQWASCSMLSPKVFLAVLLPVL